MLTDLPVEILVSIAEALVAYDPRSRCLKFNILSFLLSCQRTCYASKQVLNRYFIYTETHDEKGDRLLQQITSIYHGDFLGQVRYIQARYWYDSVHLETWKQLRSITNGQLYDPETASRYLCRGATNLQSLDTEYATDATFLNTYSQTIRSLTIRSKIQCFQTPDLVAQSHKIPVYNPLDLTFLQFVLKWPCLTHLCIDSSVLMYDRNLIDATLAWPPSSSSITHLELRVEEFEQDAARALIEAPIALRSFAFIPQCKWPHISMAHKLPQYQTIASALKKHCDTLEELTMLRAGSSWCDMMDSFGSLLQYTKLRRLEIDATMVFGLPYCMYVDLSRPSRNAGRGPMPSPKRFAAHLPPSLEALTLVVEKHLHREESQRYLPLLLEGIISEIQCGRLSNVRQLTIKFQETTYRHGCQLRGDWVTLERETSFLDDPSIVELIESISSSSCDVLLGEN